MAKDKKGPEMPSAPAWMLTYGDMVTLLLCFFVLLFAMSSIDVAKYSQVIGSFKGTPSFFEGGEETIGEGVNKSRNKDITRDNQIKPENEKKIGLKSESNDEKTIKKLLKELETIKKEIEKDINIKEKGTKNIEILRNKKGIIIRLNNTLLFDSGMAKIKPGALTVLNKIASVLKNTKNDIVIEGHTDNIPIGKRLRKKYPTNWELSTARAVNVLRYFVDVKNLNPEHISASGYAEYRPVAPNRINGHDNPEGRAKNRRVDIVILKPE